MYNCIISNIPLVRNVINHFFEKYIGINLDLTNIAISNMNSIEVNLQNIEAHPNMINELMLKKSRIKITKSTIGDFQVQIGANGIDVKLSKINLTLMPIEVNSEIKTDSSSKNSYQKSNENTKESLSDKIINFFLSNLRIEIKDLNVYMINYETKKCNMTYFNPCLSIHIPLISYDKDTLVQEPNINFYDNKMLLIDNIMINISKNCDMSDVITETNETIFALNCDKGIRVRTNINNNINVNLGDSEIIINHMQIEYIKNFIDTYLTYFISDEQPSNHNDINKENEVTKYNIHMNIDSFVMIVLEGNISQEINKVYSFDSDMNKIKQRYCYFNDNFFFFFISNADITASEQKYQIDIKELGLSYIEYLVDVPQQNSTQLLCEFTEIKQSEVNGSIYEDAYESLSKDKYSSLIEGNSFTMSKQYQYKDNTILNINTMNILCEMLSDISVNVNSVAIGIHPVYMFKVLKLVYDNIILVKDILICDFKMRQSTVLSSNNNVINDEPDSIVKETKSDESMKINIEASLKEFTMKVYSFKQDKEFSYTLSHYFTDFYYDCIYKMKSRTLSSQKEYIDDITQSAYFIIDIKDICVNMNNDTIIATINKINILFDNVPLLSLKNALQIEVENTKISFTLSLYIEADFKEVNEMISYCNMWNNTIMIYSVFAKRMMYNSNKVRKEIYEKYHGYPRPVQQSHSKGKNEAKEEEMTIVIKIEEIDTLLICENMNVGKNKEIINGKYPHVKVNDMEGEINMKSSMMTIKGSVKEIKGENLSFDCKDISTEMTMNTMIIENETEKKNIVNTITFTSIQPDQCLDEYLMKISSLNSIEHKALHKKSKSVIALKGSLNHFDFDPIELLIYSRDIYAMFNYSNSERSNDSLNDSVISSNSTHEQSKKEEAKSSSDEYTFEFTVNEIISHFGTKDKTINLLLNNIIANSSISLSVESLSLDITYTDCNRIIKVPLLSIDSTSLSYKEKESIEIVFSVNAITSSLCKDSLIYIKELSLYLSSLISKVLSIFTSSQGKKPKIKKSNTIASTSQTGITIKENYMNKINDKPISSLVLSRPVIQNKISNTFYFEIKSISLSLFKGEDLDSQIDYTSYHEDSINNSLVDKGYEVIDKMMFNRKSCRNEDEYISLMISDVKFNLDFEAESVYQISLSVTNIKILDNIMNSDIKVIFTRYDISNNFTPLLLLNISMNNSCSDISINKYTDYNINCNVTPLSTKLSLHQSTLYFIINFFSFNCDESTKVDLLYKTKNPMISSFTQISIDSMKSDSIAESKDKNFIYITKFILNQFDVYLTYHSKEISFKYDNITIPIPELDNYLYTNSKIEYTGYASMETFAEVMVNEFVSQISKYQIAIELVKSLSMIKPITTMIEHFFNIFLSPYYRYQKGDGSVINAFVKGVRGFLFSILSENFFIGEKVLKVLMKAIGITNSTKMDSKSYYVKYFIDEHEKEYNDYFYK